MQYAQHCAPTKCDTTKRLETGCLSQIALPIFDDEVNRDVEQKQPERDADEKVNQLAQIVPRHLALLATAGVRRGEYSGQRPRTLNCHPNTPPPRSPGPPGPPQASSAIHSAPMGARGMGSRRSSNVPEGYAETIGAESLPAVGAGAAGAGGR